MWQNSGTAKIQYLDTIYCLNKVSKSSINEQPGDRLKAQTGLIRVDGIVITEESLATS